jgi:hypothetical protein
MYALKQCAPFVGNLMTNHDLMLADAGFTGASNLPELQGKTIKVPFKGTTNPTQIYFNSRLSEVRGGIERTFGAVKSKFKVFKPFFRGTPSRCARTVKIAFAIHNRQLEQRAARERG